MAIRAAAAGRIFVTPVIAGEVFNTMRKGGKTPADPLSRLTLRQREILRLLVDGHTAKVIAARLEISPRTVEFHKYSMMEALGIASNSELIRFALQSGAVES
jgi:DNA-binding NarL/FixJ family response regulator